MDDFIFYGFIIKSYYKVYRRNCLLMTLIPLQLQRLLVVHFEIHLTI
jgi:hypothetical protein